MALAARIPTVGSPAHTALRCARTPLGAVMKPRTLVGAAVMASDAARLAATERPSGSTSSANPPDG
jgi:hypothetical protein